MEEKMPVCGVVTDSDLVLRREEALGSVLLGKGPERRREPRLWRKSLGVGAAEHQFPRSLPCCHAVYCPTTFFTIFSESASFAFQVQYQSCQAWQAVLTLVCTLLADRFYAGFKWP